MPLLEKRSRETAGRLRYVTWVFDPTHVGSPLAAIPPFHRAQARFLRISSSISSILLRSLACVPAVRQRPMAISS